MYNFGDLTPKKVLLNVFEPVKLEITVRMLWLRVK